MTALAEKFRVRADPIRTPALSFLTRVRPPRVEGSIQYSPARSDRAHLFSPTSPGKLRSNNFPGPFKELYIACTIFIIWMFTFNPQASDA